ncbi:MAG: purine-nucleoside phosphorylase [Bacteroidales bacterium]|nr:purine-nucleoside phosphorylase [Bacteroidales bacterium]MCF8458440.1 purine-nucleoside phosphorylase [Bacteroidales bacterium]
MLEKIKETVTYIQERIGTQPEIGIILGTGLGRLVNEINIHSELDYHDIPNFPVSTVHGHKGKLIFGELGGKQVMAMQGRFHFYEGYPMSAVTFPIRVMKLLGINHLFVSNAAGGINRNHQVGDMMILNDHINLFPEHPLRGRNIDELGPRFPDMSINYDKELIARAIEIGHQNNFRIHEGVYAGVTGPTFETPAEYRYLHIIGADAVGMSTVPEVIVARHMEMTCFAISIISDLGMPEQLVKITHEEVLDVARTVEPKMTLLFKELIGTL